VVFAGLASVQDRALVLPTIAASLGAPDTGSAGLLDLLALTLRDRPILLLLDNVEQVVASAPDIAALLERCPFLTILATSRVVLHIAAERVVPISPLPLPDEARGTEAENLADTDALAMFLDRARAVDPDFALTDENIATVAALVRRLDGLPLAIELTAAWTRVLPPAALLAQMDRQLPMLTGGGRDAPERQQTMRNAIAWSYDLLGPREQRMFRRL
jgi:predicted ATPase